MLTTLGVVSNCASPIKKSFLCLYVRVPCSVKICIDRALYVYLYFYLFAYFLVCHPYIFIILFLYFSWLYLDLNLKRIFHLSVTTTTLELVVVPSMWIYQLESMKDQPLSVPDFNPLANFLIFDHITADQHSKLPTEHKTDWPSQLYSTMNIQFN